MKQPTKSKPTMPPSAPAPGSTIYTATIELLAAWREQDATTDPEQIRAAESEVEEFKKALT